MLLAEHGGDCPYGNCNLWEMCILWSFMHLGNVASAVEHSGNAIYDKYVFSGYYCFWAMLLAEQSIVGIAIYEKYAFCDHYCL